MAGDINCVTAVGVVGGDFEVILVAFKEMDAVASFLCKSAGEGEPCGAGSDDGDVDGQGVVLAVRLVIRAKFCANGSE